MFKKVIIIIGVVFLGIIALAIVGAFIGGDEPQEVVIVEKTVAPTVEPTVAPAPEEQEVVLTSEEAKVYKYIARTYPKVDALYARMKNVIERDSVSGLVDCCDEFVGYAKSWQRLDWANGQVTDLETAFGSYMEGSRKYYRNWLNGTLGGGDITQCATNALKAEAVIDRWAPRVEDRLDEVSMLADESY